MTQIYVCLNIYQEEQMLPDCLTSIRSSMPYAKIVAIDGAYKSWIDGVKFEAALNLERGHQQIGMGLLQFINPESSDRTYEICKEFKVEHFISPPINDKGEYQPWPSEATKRNEFFKIVPENDYVFMIDADERLVGVPEEFVENAYNIYLQRDDNINKYVVQRIFKNLPGTKIQGAHHAVWQHGTLTKKDDPNRAVIRNAYLSHLWCKRNELNRFRHMAKGAYYVNGLIPEEAEFRAINKI